MTPEIRKRIVIVQGDITKLDVDAIVNAANSSLLGGTQPRFVPQVAAGADGASVGFATKF